MVHELYIPHSLPPAQLQSLSSWAHNRPGRGMPAAKYARYRGLLRRGFENHDSVVPMGVGFRLFRNRRAQASAPCSNPEISMATSGDIF